MPIAKHVVVENIRTKPCHDSEERPSQDQDNIDDRPNREQQTQPLHISLSCVALIPSSKKGYVLILR